MSIDNLGKYFVPEKSVVAYEYLPTFNDKELNPDQKTLTTGVSYKITGYANGFYGIQADGSVWYVPKKKTDRYRIQKQPTGADPGFAGWFNETTDFLRNSMNQGTQYAGNLESGFEKATTDLKQDVSSTFTGGLSLLGSFGNWVLIVLGIVAIILVSITFMRFQ